MFLWWFKNRSKFTLEWSIEFIVVKCTCAISVKSTYELFIQSNIQKKTNILEKIHTSKWIRHEWWWINRDRVAQWNDSWHILSWSVFLYNGAIQSRDIVKVSFHREITSRSTRNTNFSILCCSHPVRFASNSWILRSYLLDLFSIPIEWLGWLLLRSRIFFSYVSSITKCGLHVPLVK